MLNNKIRRRMRGSVRRDKQQQHRDGRGHREMRPGAAREAEQQAAEQKRHDREV